MFMEHLQHARHRAGGMAVRITDPTVEPALWGLWCSVFRKKHSVIQF